MSTRIHTGLLDQNVRTAVSHGQREQEQHGEGYCPLLIA